MIIYGNDFDKNVISFSRENNFGIEITRYADPDALDNLPGNYPIIKETLRGFSKISMHGAYNDILYASKDPLIRQVAKTRSLQSVQAAASHSVNHIVFHTSFRAFIDGHAKHALDNFIKRTTEFWNDFEQHIPSTMTVYLENVEENNPDIIMKLLESINSPKFKCCLDVGHAFFNSKIPLKDWINTIGNFLGYVHIHDNDGTNDQHLPLGEGKIPIIETINAISDISKDIPYSICT